MTNIKSEKKEPVPVEFVRCSLAEYFGEKAQYRRELAEYQGKPWDAEKNARYADSLDCMVEYIHSLPDDDPTLRALGACPDLYFHPFFSMPLRDPLEGPYRADNSAIHCAVEGPEDCAEWLEFWVASAIEEAEENREREDSF